MCLPSSRKAADSLVSVKRPVSAKLKAISLTALASASFFQIFQLYSAAEKRAILDGSDCCIGLSMTPPIRLGSTPGCRNFSPPPKIRCCLELSVHGQLIQSWTGRYVWPDASIFCLSWVKKFSETSPQIFPPVRVIMLLFGRLRFRERSSSSRPLPQYWLGTKIISFFKPG